MCKTVVPDVLGFVVHEAYMPISRWLAVATSAQFVNLLLHSVSISNKSSHL